MKPTTPDLFDELLTDVSPWAGTFQTNNPSLADAVAYCRKLEALVAPLGWHVALTGGTLYKEGPRKDVDVICYRHDVRKPEEAKSPQEVVVALEAAVAFSAWFRSPNGEPDRTPEEYHDKLCYVGKSAEKGDPTGFRVDLFFL